MGFSPEPVSVSVFPWIIAITIIADQSSPSSDIDTDNEDDDDDCHLSLRRGLTSIVLSLAIGRSTLHHPSPISVVASPGDVSVPLCIGQTDNIKFSPSRVKLPPLVIHRVVVIVGASVVNLIYVGSPLVWIDTPSPLNDHFFRWGQEKHPIKMEQNILMLDVGVKVDYLFVCCSSHDVFNVFDVQLEQNYNPPLCSHNQSSVF